MSAEKRACPDPKAMLDCKDRPAPKACAERSDRLEHPARPER